MTLTLSNPSPGTFFEGDPDGLGLYPGFPCVTSFDLAFSQAVKITGYQIGFINSGTVGTFALTGGGAGAASSLNNPLNPAGTYSLSSLYGLAANQTGHFAATFTAPNFSQLKSLTVDTDFTPAAGVPEIDALSGTGALTLLAGALALAEARRRRAG